MVTDEHARPRTATQPIMVAPIGDPPRRRLSILRVLVLLAALAGAGFGTFTLIAPGSAATVARRVAPAFAPYVDVTLTPTYPFQSPSANPVSSAYLGFVVSRTGGAPCTPTWGGFYTLDQAATNLDLDARVAQLRDLGGHPMIAFGGQANSDLATTCTDAGRLTAAYQAPIARYHSSAIDLDLEGASLADASADTRRARAIAAVQRRTHVKVWLTLPVSAQGLTARGLAVARAMLGAHVRLAGVNAMAMDFGAGQGAARDMIGTVERSLRATHAQVRALWRDGDAAAWQHVGATVMIGVNDTAGERFTIADARRLARFAAREGLPRVSAWSLNRDAECGGAFAQVGVVSNTCSGVVQSPLQFTHILSRLPGTTRARTTPASAAASVPEVQSVPDNPATSPYPVWQAGAAYNTGYKVVWHRSIYQAKWWSQGTAPDASLAGGTPGPWLLLGPVPAGSRAPKPHLLTGAHPKAWSPTTVYRQGAEASFGGLPYRARWYTRGDQPSSLLPGAPQAPWEPLFTAPGEPTQAGTGVTG